MIHPSKPTPLINHQTHRTNHQTHQSINKPTPTKLSNQPSTPIHHWTDHRFTTTTTDLSPSLSLNPDPKEKTKERDRDFDER